MTSAAFMTYIEQYFAPQIAEKRLALGLPPDAPALLLYDGASVHFGVDIELIRKRFHIHILLLLPHSSAILQPLDVVVHGVFKQKLSKLFKYQEGESARARRNRWCISSILALSFALCLLHVLSAWKKSGLYPFDPSIPLKSGMIMDDIIPLQPIAPRGGPLGRRIDDGIIESDIKLPFQNSLPSRLPLASLDPNVVSSSSSPLKN